MPVHSLSAVVLAGGHNRRMGGRDKALLPLDGETLLDHIIDILGQVADDVLVAGRVTDKDATGFARFVLDDRPDAGPLGGLYTGLRHAHGGAVIAVACDMPFLDAGTLRYLATLLSDFEAVVPIVGGQEQPLHAVYRCDIASKLEGRLTRGELKLSALLSDLHVRYVNDSELIEAGAQMHSFVNVNTVEEWHSIRLRAFAP